MALAVIQRALARLYTDAELRERFFSDPVTVGAELGLSGEETDQLLRSCAKQIAAFANSLHRKRLGEVRNLLPATQRALGKRFGELFLRYAETQSPHGCKKHADDAIRFAAHLAGGDIAPWWIRDLARHESAWIEAVHGNRFCMLRCFGHRIDDWKKREDAARPPSIRPTLALWFRLSRRGRWWQLSLSVPAFVCRACFSSQTAASLSSETRSYPI